LHLGNTLLLLAALSLTASWLSSDSGSFRFALKRGQLAAIGICLLATIATGITGAVAALADTLFPATSLRSSLAQDLTPNTSALLHLRLLHPAVATVAACYVLWVIVRAATGPRRFSPRAIAFVAAIFVQFSIGLMNVLLLVPVWLQIVHLFGADVLWILLVLTSADLVLERAISHPVRALVGGI
jgi:cytochrome c oxidase assembly protein subunit 15